MMPLELIAGILGFALASVLLPMVIRWAREQSLLDFPDAIRRHHSVPTPRVGGVAVFIAIVLTACFVLVWNSGTGGQTLTPLWPGLLLGASIVFVTGLIDDLRGVVPVLKLIGHSTAALIVVAYGFQVDSITLAGGQTLSLGLAAVPITVLWIVGVTNAFNLIDGVDGLASTFALIGLVTAVIVEMMIQPTPSLVVTASAVGAMLAFLRFNRPPAKIFLGDSGSTTLGFFLSIQLVVSATGPRNATYALIPLFALAYPLTDTAIAIARRWLRGHPFSRADGRHIHHQVRALGLSPRRTVDLLGLLFASIAVMGIAITFAPPRVTFAIATGGSILLFATFVYGVRWLGYHEFSEFAASVVSVIRNGRRHVRRRISASDLAGKLVTAESIDQLKQMLDDAAGELGLLEVTLDTTPSHYVGPSHRRIAPKTERPLRVDCPIAWERTDGHIGEATLRFWCERPDTQTHPGVERLAMRLVPAVQYWFQTRNYVSSSVPDRRPETDVHRPEHYQPRRRASGGLDARHLAAAIESSDGKTPGSATVTGG